MAERAKRGRAWKSPHARKARRGSISLSPLCISPFSCGVIFTRARVLLALLSLRKNRGVLEVYQIIDSLIKSMRIRLTWLNWKRYHIQRITKLYYFFFCHVPVIVMATVMMQRHFFFLWWTSQDGHLWNYLKQDRIVITDIPHTIAILIFMGLLLEVDMTFTLPATHHLAAVPIPILAINTAHQVGTAMEAPSPRHFWQALISLPQTK